MSERFPSRRVVRRRGLNKRTFSPSLPLASRPDPAVKLAGSVDPPRDSHRQHGMKTPDPRDFSELLRLTNEAGILVLVLDIEGRILRFNRAVEQLIGYSSEEVGHQDWFELAVPVESRVLMRQACLHGNREDRAFGHATPLLHRSGGERLIEWFHSDLNDDEGLRLGVICVGRDVTDLKNVRQALIESEERNRGVLETAVNAIITISDRGIIETVNSSTTRMFGYSKEELVGQNVSMLMPSPYREQHDGYIDRYKATNVRKIIGIGRETIAQRKDGTVFPVDLSVGEVTLGTRRIFTGIIRDISDRKELEQKLIEISEGEQQRIGQDIHDDLCQQLAAIGCLAQVVQQKLRRSRSSEAESLSEIIKLISQANARAREMSRGLVPVVLDSNGLMAALTELATGTEKIFRLSCRFWCDPPVHVRDNKAAIQLYRIAQEAVANAIKHSKADRIEITLSRADGCIQLCIRDNGVGVPDHSPGRGTGMGLFTMSHRAKMLGGSLTVEPVDFGGTKVTCTAPLPDAIDPPNAP